VWEVVGGLCRPRAGSLPGWPDVAAGQFWLGRMGEGVADEVVLAVKRTAPAPWLELQCHGGREGVARLLALPPKGGVRVVSWPQLERETAPDPLQALAAVALAHAPTVRTAAILLDQYHGAFARQVRAVLTALQNQKPEQARRELAALARFS